MQDSSFHENLERDELPEGSSDRAFGLTVGAVCAAIGVAALWYGKTSGWWWLCAGAALVAVAVVRPELLARANRLWMKLGLVLFRVVNPLVMGIMYYLCIVPLGVLMKLFRKDPLRLRRDPAAITYWTRRDPANPHSRGMKDQF